MLICFFLCSGLTLHLNVRPEGPPVTLLAHLSGRTCPAPQVGPKWGQFTLNFTRSFLFFLESPRAPSQGGGRRHQSVVDNQKC